MIKLPIPSKALLVRVAADATSGEWNGPADPDSGEFVYVPIPQDRANAEGMAREYLPIVGPALRAFSGRVGMEVPLPGHLHGRRMHLDPDFDHLTYGDTQTRGKKLLDFKENDWVVFYSALRPTKKASRLIYALIGLLVVDSVRRVAEIPPEEHDYNAHTRLLQRVPTDLVVSGKPGVSGRFERFISIGELRNGSYRVRTDLLEAWGGLGVRDGWIQRSANPPLFLDPARFAIWLQAKAPALLVTNNP